MEECNSSSETDGPLLEVIARELGDPGLFPPEVVRLHNEGQARRARALLLKHSRFEPNFDRKSKQLQAAKNLRVWLEPIPKAPPMTTWNGIGTTLYGKCQPKDDGTYVATLWFTLVFLPIWPLAAYLVLPAEKGRGWHFMARTPFPPFARRMRWVTGAGIAALIGSLLLADYQSSTRVDLLVYNGFDRSVVARVGEDQQTVRLRQHAVFENLPLARTSLSASWDSETEPFESVDVDLAGHARETVVYNIADRAVLAVDYVLYGEGTASEGHWLGKGPVFFLEEAIDYRFEAPPDSKDVREGYRIENSVLHAIDDGRDPVEVVVGLVGFGQRQQALAVARAELMAHPDNANLAWSAAVGVLGDDFEAQLELVRQCLERAPEEVDLHRVYQELWPKDERDPLREEYASLLAANPASPMYHYLVGRIADRDSDEDLRHYRAALEIDPDYGPVYRALGYRAATRKEWSEAVSQYDRFASFGAEEALEVVGERIRLRRRLGHDPGEIRRILAETSDTGQGISYTSFLAAHLAVEQDPGALAEEGARVLRDIESSLLPGATSPIVHNVRADLAVTAGELESARAELSQLASENRDPAVALRLALSVGATREDIELLLDITDWHATLDPPRQLLGLELLGAIEREMAIQAMRGSVPGSELASIARLLGNPVDLLQAERLATQLSEQPLVIRTVAYFAAARTLASESRAAAARARRSYMYEARSLALPGELPYLGNGETLAR
jgi:tetratricopeptide (TPR) repeat protein